MGRQYGSADALSRLLLLDSAPIEECLEGRVFVGTSGVDPSEDFPD